MLVEKVSKKISTSSRTTIPYNERVARIIIENLVRTNPSQAQKMLDAAAAFAASAAADRQITEK